MKRMIALFCLSLLFWNCSKDEDNSDTLNGINVTKALAEVNQFRTNGVAPYPPAPALTWNDTLSHAAYNFAIAKAQDGQGTNVYVLSNGQMILDFPSLLGFSRNAIYALYYGYPSGTDLASVIASGFQSVDPMIVSGLMNPSARQMGMAQSGGAWYLILSN